MIVADEGSHLAVFTQPDHALLAARLFGLWRTDGLPEHPRREELLFAIREHDNGWQRSDAAPRVSPKTGLPTSFHRMPAAERLEIWRRGVRRHAAERAYASLLIVRHAREVNRDYFDQPDWSEFAAELDALAEELGEASGIGDADLASDYAWLSLTDTLSLGACGALGSSGPSGEQGDYRFALAPGRIRLAPFPLVGDTTLEIPYRRLPKRAYSDATDLTAELASAVWQRRPVKVEPLGRREGADT